MLTGRCYCGQSTVRAARAPQIVTYCHCNDCRRLSGAPVAVFAAFAPEDLVFDPPLGAGISVVDGAERWFCDTCRSPLAARYAYLPEQVYVPIGLLDQAPELAPQLHAHAGSRLPWLNIDDDLPRNDTSARAALGSTRT